MSERTVPTPTTERVDGLATRRQRRQYAHRSAWFATAEDCPSGGTAAALVDATDADRLYICGHRPWLNIDGLRTWAMDGLPDGWSHGSHYLNTVAPVLRYKRPDGSAVEVMRASSWFGEGLYSPVLAAAAYGRLAEAVAGAFDEGRLLGTPASTGRYLFMRTVPFGAEYPVLSDDLQDLIRATSGQGRVELLPRAAMMLPGLAEYDGRFMYAAVCWGLGHGPPSYDHQDEFAGYQRGRYRVRFTVPPDWSERCKCGAPGHLGIGLLGVQEEGGWRYPSAPGSTWETWVDGAEVGVALRHGWPVVILDRLLWPHHGDGPLDTWSRKLVALREQMADDPLGAAAVRNLVLHAIGAFHGRPHEVTKSAHINDAADVPAEAAPTLRRDGDHFVWSEGEEQAWPEMAHPEWSAAVWARTRARLLHGPGNTGALHVPAHAVIAFRTDAIYLTERATWRDDGKAGRLRLKRYLEGPLPAPQSHEDLLVLRKGEGAADG